MYISFACQCKSAMTNNGVTCCKLLDKCPNITITLNQLHYTHIKSLRNPQISIHKYHWYANFHVLNLIELSYIVILRIILSYRLTHMPR